MPALTMLFKNIILPAVLKTIIQQVSSNSLAQNTGSELVDMFKDLAPEACEAWYRERNLERVTRDVASMIEPYDQQDIHFDAVLLAVRDTILGYPIDEAYIVSQNMNIQTVYREVLAVGKGYVSSFSQKEEEIYQKILFLIVENMIHELPRKAEFEYLFSSTMLERTDDIQNRTKDIVRILKRDDDAIQYEQVYRRNVAHELNKLEVFGHTKMNRLVEKQNLTDIFVHTTTFSVKRPEDDSNLSLNHITDDLDPTQEQKLVKKVLQRFRYKQYQKIDDILEKSTRMVIRGEAGAGKSTFLQWIAVMTASQLFSGTLQDWNTCIPFFIRLRGIVNQPFPKPEEFISMIDCYYGAVKPPTWVTSHLQNGSAVVLIDGVDELPRSQRKDFFKALQGLVRNFPRSRYIISSRPTGLKDQNAEEWEAWETWIKKQQFTDLTMNPMTSQSAELLVRKWYEALALHDNEDKEFFKHKAEDLCRQLRTRSELRQLASTPLLCAMICSLHYERQEALPAARLQLYRDCIDVMLNKRDSGRKIPLDKDESYPKGLNEDQKLSLLQGFAYHLMVLNRSEFERERVDKHFESRLKYLGISSNDISGSQIRALFVERTSLLREPRIGVIDFAHRTFQEYLTAKGALNEDSIETILQRADNDQWRETVISLAGEARRKECDSLLENLIELGNKKKDRRHYLHLLAVACLETAREVSPEVREKVLDYARFVLPPKDDDEARLVASAGESIIPLLKGFSGYREVSSCIKALAHIGGTTALYAIKEYVETPRANTFTLLTEYWDFFDRKQYAEVVLSGCEDLSIYNLTSWEGFEFLYALRRLFIWGCKNQDLSGLSGLNNLQVLSIKGGPSKLEHVSLLNNLSILHIGSEGSFDCAWIQNSRHLTDLELAVQTVDNPDLLQSLNSLQSLSLSIENPQIQEPLPSLRHLQSLSISPAVRNIIEPMLIDIEELQEVELRHFPKDILKYFESIYVQEFTFNIDEDVDDLDWSHLPKNVQKVNIVGQFQVLDQPINIQIIDELFQNISFIRHMSLDIEGMVDLSKIANFKQLESLELVGYSELDLTPLSELIKLKYIGLGTKRKRRGFEMRGVARQLDLSPLAKIDNLNHLVIARFIGTLDLSVLRNKIDTLTIYGDPQAVNQWISLGGKGDNLLSQGHPFYEDLE